MKKLILTLIIAMFGISMSAETFAPQSATIVDNSGQSSTFSSFDAPSMSVTDNGSSVAIVWGGDRVVLRRNSDGSSYSASGQSSKGPITVTAYRSNRSKKIYLVTVGVNNASLPYGIKRMTINFKP